MNNILICKLFEISNCPNCNNVLEKSFCGCIYDFHLIKSTNLNIIPHRLYFSINNKRVHIYKIKNNFNVDFFPEKINILEISDLDITIVELIEQIETYLIFQ